MRSLCSERRKGGCTVSCPIKIHWSYTQSDDESCPDQGIGCEGVLSLWIVLNCGQGYGNRLTVSYGVLKLTVIGSGKAFDFYTQSKEHG